LSLKWDIPQPWSSLPTCQLFLLPHRHTDSRGGTATLVRRGIAHHSVFIPGLTHSKAIQVILAGKPVKILCGLPLPFPPTDRSGPVRLFRRGNAGLHSRRPQRQTRGLKVADEHKTGKTPAWLCRGYLLSDLCNAYPNTPTNNPIQPLGYYRCLGDRDNQETHIPVVSDFVICVKRRPPPSTHWHYLSLILPAPTGSPWFQAHWLGQLPNLLWRSNSFRFGITRRDGNWQLRWELLRRRAEGSDGIYSQTSPACRATASDTVWHSGRSTPEVLAAEAVAGHQWPHSKSRSQPPAEVSDPPAQRVEERPVQCHTRFPRSWRHVAVEDGQAGDESSYSVSPGHSRGNRSLRLLGSRSPCWHSGDSVSASGRPFGPGSYWDGWRGAEVVLSDACQWTQVNQPWRGSQSNQGSQGRQGSWPKRYNVQSLEASFPASGIASGPELQRNFSHPSLPFLVEARSRDLYH